ncbi:hypothetical protein ABPG74_004800 [Tetrahymena malaccensis]
MSTLASVKKDQAAIKEIMKFKFKEPKLRETTLDKSVRCMTLGIKKQNLIKEFLIDEIQSIDLCVDRIYEIKRQLKLERQEFFRRPLTQARIKEKRKNDEHYDDFINDYEEQESKLKDYELVYYNIKSQNNKATTYATITASTDANPVSVTTSSKILGIDKEKTAGEKKKDKKNLQMYGKLIQKDPVFRMYKTKMADDGMFIDEEIEAPSFKYKYLTKDQLLQQKIDNLPKKHNIPEKYCRCCNQLVRRHYCPHDYCEKPCLRQEKEKRLRQQYLDKNGGVRKQKKPLYRASVLANDISQAKSALDETMTIEQQQEAERIKQMKIQAHLQQQKEQELKIQQFKLQHAEQLQPKKKGRKPKVKVPEGTPSNTNNNNNNQATSQISNTYQQANPSANNSVMKGEYDSISKGDMSIEYAENKYQNMINNNSMMMDIEKNNKDIHMDSYANRKGSFNIPSGGNNSYDNKDKIDYNDFNHKNDSYHDEQQILQQLVAQENVQNLLGSKIIYRNEDSSYESSSSGISSGSSDDEDKIKIDD